MIQSRDLAQGFWKILETTDEKEISRAFDAFVSFVEEHNLASLLPSVVRHLEFLQKQKQDFNTLTIETPFPLDTSLERHIQNHMRIEHTIEKKHVLNKDLIGGFRATYQGQVLDASILYNLQVLKKQLTK